VATDTATPPPPPTKRYLDALAGRAFTPLRSALVLGAIVMLAALSGCAPIHASFLQPQAPGGTITNRHCPPQPEILLFSQEGVVAAVLMDEVGSGRRAIRLTFEVPRGRTVRLLGSSLTVTTARGERAVSQLSGVWRGSKNRSADVRPESLMVGRTERWRLGTVTPYGNTRHDFFEFAAEFATQLGDDFTATLPPVLLDGFSWDLPPVRFRRVRRWLISPLNC